MINERTKEKNRPAGGRNNNDTLTPQSCHQSSGQSIAGKKISREKSIDPLAGPLDTVQP